MIPDEIRQKFPDLIDLIIGSESMNDEERQYWINILPIMTPDQVQNLREILANERVQLKAIDDKYAKEIERIGSSEQIRQTGEQRSRKRSERQSKEQAHKDEETAVTDDLLKKIEEA
ncbi:MAG: hypothetical protein RIQ56_166 [Candidatus Parcubacteria bacterium]